MVRLEFHTVAAVVLILVGAACGPRPEGDDDDYEPYRAPDAGSLDCVPNLDEKITSEELQPALGVEARYLVSPPNTRRSVDLAGESTGGTRVWDWSGERPNDRVADIAAESVSDRWYADSFPDGEFVLPVDLSGEIDGIYRTTDDRMLLLGLASRSESPPSGKTLYAYEQPVVVYRFPIRKGQRWVSTGEVDDGTLRGAPYAGKDTYRVRVRARGEMQLPDFTFEQVHRVDTRVTVRPAAGQSVSRRQVSFVAECFGEVARATSPDGVTKADFEKAAEVRRLAAP